MRIFRNGVCYVTAWELHAVPGFFKMDKLVYAPMEFAVITDSDSISHISSREDIIDYDLVSSLSDSELDKLVKKYEIEVESLSKRYLEALLYGRLRVLYQDKEYVKNYELCKTLYNKLFFYKQNKKQIDDYITNYLALKNIVSK